MLLFVTTVHFLVAILLIVFVLIQDAKGGGVFGMSASGGSNQVFSATGAANFLVKVTRALAVLFAVTCIALTYMTSKPSASVTDDFAPAAAAGAPTPDVGTAGQESQAPGTDTAPGTANENSPTETSPTKTK